MKATICDSIKDARSIQFPYIDTSPVPLDRSINLIIQLDELRSNFLTKPLLFNSAKLHRNPRAQAPDYVLMLVMTNSFLTILSRHGMAVMLRL